MAALIIGGSLQLVGLVFSYLFHDHFTSHNLPLESASVKRDNVLARIGLGSAILGFVLSMIAGVLAI